MRVWILVSVCAFAAVLALILTQLNPPKRMTLAAGPDDGAYAELARDYAQVLLRDNIMLDVIETEGSVENARLLADGEVDAAILQGGIPVPSREVEAIGAIFYEPMVFLARRDAVIPSNPALWSGLRINSGRVGSGTEAAFRDFERILGLTREANAHFELPYDRAVAALLSGEIDIAAFVAPIFAPYLIDAYDETGLRVLELDHAEAISRRLEFADVVTLPAGGMSLDPVLPNTPRHLIALEARLAIRSELHPALVNRLTMAAIELHRNRGIITDPGMFPSVVGTGLTVNNAARQLILTGPSTLHDWLPYWVAAQINRLFLLFLPLVFIILPLLRLLPLSYAFLMRWRVWQHYPEIRRIEDELAGQPDQAALREMQAQMRELDERLAGLKMPPAYRQVQYDARLHLELVQKRISDMQRGQAADTG